MAFAVQKLTAVNYLKKKKKKKKSYSGTTLWDASAVQCSAVQFGAARYNSLLFYLLIGGLGKKVMVEVASNELIGITSNASIFEQTSFRLFFFESCFSFLRLVALQLF